MVWSVWCQVGVARREAEAAAEWGREEARQREAATLEKAEAQRQLEEVSNG
jgi:hypothetical protein